MVDVTRARVRVGKTISPSKLRLGVFPYMFVTEQEAQERLSSERNLLRTGEIRSTTPEQTSSSPQVEAEWPDPEIDEITLPSLRTEDSLDTLNRLIASGSSQTNDGRAHYAGKREAQKAIAEVDSLLGPTMA